MQHLIFSENRRKYYSMRLVLLGDFLSLFGWYPLPPTINNFLFPLGKLDWKCFIFSCCLINFIKERLLVGLISLKNCYRSPTKKIDSKESRKGHISLCPVPSGGYRGPVLPVCKFSSCKVEVERLLQKELKTKNNGSTTIPGTLSRLKWHPNGL